MSEKVNLMGREVREGSRGHSVTSIRRLGNRAYVGHNGDIEEVLRYWLKRIGPLVLEETPVRLSRVCDSGFLGDACC